MPQIPLNIVWALGYPAPRADRGQQHMHSITSFERDDAAQLGRSVRVLLLSSEGEQGPIARRLASLGCRVDLVAAVSNVTCHPAGYALFVLDCASDGVGGLEAATRVVMMLDEAMSRLPVILISQECAEQRFPADRMQPTVLRAPLSAVSIKVGFEHALRDRLVGQAA